MLFLFCEHNSFPAWLFIFFFRLLSCFIKFNLNEAKIEKHRWMIIFKIFNELLLNLRGKDFGIFSHAVHSGAGYGIDLKLLRNHLWIDLKFAFREIWKWFEINFKIFPGVFLIFPRSENSDRRSQILTAAIVKCGQNLWPAIGVF